MCLRNYLLHQGAEDVKLMCIFMDLNVKLLVPNALFINALSFYCSVV
jgi:hypothetical protein